VSNPEVFATCEVTVKAKILVFLLSSPSAGCTEGDSTKVPEVTLSPTVDKRVTWSVGDPRIATVDENGVLKGIKAGKTTLTCTSVAAPAYSKTIDLTISQAIIVLHKLNLRMYEGECDTITHHVFPQDRVVQTVTWQSSNPEVATIDADGVVHALKAGTAILTCAWTYNPERMEKCLVKVTKPYVPPIAEPLPTQVYTEYSFDNDPGFGHGRPVSGTQWGSRKYEFDVSGLQTGVHMLFIRCKDEHGRWSPTVCRPFCIIHDYDIVAMNYYIDESFPGQSVAHAIPLSALEGNQVVFDVPVAELSYGQHTLTVRIQDSLGQWIEVCNEPFTVVESATGILQMKLDFAFDISITGTHCLIVPRGDSVRSDCRVEIYDVAGRLLVASKWLQTEGQLSLPVSVRPNSVLIVKIQDMKDGRAHTRRVIAE